MFKPIRTFRAVLEELIIGVEAGTVVIGSQEHKAARDHSPRQAKAPPTDQKTTDEKRCKGCKAGNLPDSRGCISKKDLGD